MFGLSPKKRNRKNNKIYAMTKHEELKHEQQKHEEQKQENNKTLLEKLREKVNNERLQKPMNKFDSTRISLSFIEFVKVREEYINMYNVDVEEYKGQFFNFDSSSFIDEHVYISFETDQQNYYKYMHPEVFGEYACEQVAEVKKTKATKNKKIIVFDYNNTTPNEKNKIRLSNGKLYVFMGRKHKQEIIEKKIAIPEGYYLYKDGEKYNVFKLFFDAKCVEPNENNKIVVSNGKEYKFMGIRHKKDILNEIMIMPEGFEEYNRKNKNGEIVRGIRKIRKVIKRAGKRTYQPKKQRKPRKQKYREMTIEEEEIMTKSMEKEEEIMMDKEDIKKEEIEGEEIKEGEIEHEEIEEEEIIFKDIKEENECANEIENDNIDNIMCVSDDDDGTEVKEIITIDDEENGKKKNDAFENHENNKKYSLFHK